MTKSIGTGRALKVVGLAAVIATALATQGCSTPAKLDPNLVCPQGTHQEVDPSISGNPAGSVANAFFGGGVAAAGEGSGAQVFIAELSRAYKGLTQRNPCVKDAKPGYDGVVPYDG